MQRIGGEQHARKAQFAHRPGYRCDLVRRTSELLVRQDQGGIAGKGAEDVSRFTIVEVV